MDLLTFLPHIHSIGKILNIVISVMPKMVLVFPNVNECCVGPVIICANVCLNALKNVDALFSRHLSADLCGEVVIMIQHLHRSFGTTLHTIYSQISRA